MLQDLHKWKSRFHWSLAGYFILFLLLACFSLLAAWSINALHPGAPVRTLIGFGMIMIVGLAVFCVITAAGCLGVIIKSLRFEAERKERKKNRPPLTMENLRQEVQPEKLEQTRISLQKLRLSYPQSRDLVETSTQELMERYRADLGSTPEVEAELAKLKAFSREL